MIVNEYIITIGFGGRGVRSNRGRGLIEEIRYVMYIEKHLHAHQWKISVQIINVLRTYTMKHRNNSM